MKIILQTNIEALSEFYLQTLVLLYRPCEIFGKNDTSDSVLEVRAMELSDLINVRVILSDNGKREEYILSEQKNEYPESINAAKAVVGKCFCITAERVYGFCPPFGIISGIRPAKLVLSYLEKGYAEEEIKRLFNKAYLIEPQKLDILTEIASAERALLHSLETNTFSLYISIPFCPTRCSYCSFVSYSTARLLSMIPDYLVRLYSDIRRIGEITREIGLKLSSVYVGGGTPSILSELQIKELIECVHKSFDTSYLSEFTFEAGRPDTVTKEKLLALKEGGVDRISINTQTVNDKVLKRVGRQHTFSDYLHKLSLAREVGFDCINTDLIAGLPGESAESFLLGVEKIISCNVENITVHSLTLKKSSDLRTDKEYELLCEGMRVRKMLDGAQALLRDGLYYPYYIYRQKNTVGNLENTGYAKKNKACFYNIVMMEEFHSVFSAGAGAVTKLVSPDRKHIERLFEQKYPYEYLDKSDKILDVDAVRRFYSEYFGI